MNVRNVLKQELSSGIALKHIEDSTLSVLMVLPPNSTMSCLRNKTVNAPAVAQTNLATADVTNTLL